VAAGAITLALLGAALPAGASGISIKVSPTKGLANGQSVKITGSGLPVTTGGKPNSFFADECNVLVTGKLSPADASHCDASVAKVLKLSKKGAFSATYKVVSGAIGDGSCGTPGHLTCVIGVGDLGGQGKVVKITFK